ncbi:hypothetical protein P3T76_005786 [Phytophthora citrophthora]|uniref:Uncharacterized protein n=1 Tax=Phytophthora citrophthora TaxID=4793 RepID=A0AAD9LQJ1_9STRA|nr:hypothetical protein P3T76_005786 [Phytophthora citrophthora]
MPPNRRKFHTSRVALKQSPVTIFHTTLVATKGNPRIKNLLESTSFRQTVEHQFSVETGIPGDSLDRSNVVLDSRVTNSTRLEKWEQLAGSTQPLFAIPLKRLQPIEALPTTPVQAIEELSTTPLQPVEELSTTDPMPAEPEVAKEPTMAEMMAQITALGTSMTNLRRDHSLELASMRRDHSLEIKGLTDKITTMERDHSLEIKGLAGQITAQNVRIAALRDTISAQNNEIDVLDMKLEDAAKTDRILSSKIEELQKTIATQGQSIEDMLPLIRDLVYRKALEWYRNLLFDSLRTAKGDIPLESVAMTTHHLQALTCVQIFDFAVPRHGIVNNLGAVLVVLEVTRTVRTASTGGTPANTLEASRCCWSLE